MKFIRFNADHDFTRWEGGIPSERELWQIRRSHLENDVAQARAELHRCIWAEVGDGDSGGSEYLHGKRVFKLKGECLQALAETEQRLAEHFKAKPETDRD